jgi:segregation and condensation protein B
VPSLVEALIFASELPLSRGRIASIIGDVKADDVVRIVERLNRGYELSCRPLAIVEFGGGYQMVTREEYAPWIRKVFSQKRKIRLSQAALETVAIIAYKQPVARIELERIRGVNVDGVLKSLLERNLVRIVGRDRGIGRPFLYGTTQEFLSHFGLARVRDLPDYEEVKKGAAPWGQAASAPAAAEIAEAESIEQEADFLGGQDAAAESTETDGGLVEGEDA